MARTVIVGDVHGCRSELERLLSYIGVGPQDQLIFVGDLIGRGPDTLGVVKLVRKLGAVVVRGNHEHKLLMYRAARQRKQAAPRVSRALREVSERIGEGLSRWMSEMPYWFDVPEHGVRVVHGGMVPGRKIEETEPGLLVTIRGMTPEGDPTTARECRLWGETYAGPPHVVFGHNAGRAPQIHEWATGIDTGCVYGGSLTAMVLLPGEQVPSTEHRTSVLVSVPAARQYFGVHRQP
ncbi:MAG: serine/threonine protein phosphatase [Deltaproteobacteria bacterium]|nr:serine/threonine protein phosphatase [Deltaproteobacteria bacterium]